jgi:hypothetical protein
MEAVGSSFSEKAVSYLTLSYWTHNPMEKLMEPPRNGPSYAELRERIRELEASARQVADKAIGRITELEAAIKAAMENEVSLDSERGSTWHILNDALAPQSDAKAESKP